MLTRFLRFIAARTVSLFDLFCIVIAVELFARETIGIVAYFGLCLVLGIVSTLLARGGSKGVHHGQ